MYEKTLRKVIKDEIRQGNKELKKDLKLMFMTRKDCQAVHQGRVSHNGNGNGNGSLKKEQLKFWTKLVGLVSGLNILLWMAIAYISRRFGG